GVVPALDREQPGEAQEVAPEAEGQPAAPQHPRTVHEGEAPMTEPRWTDSQRAVEAALSRAPRTIKQLQEETGYSYATVVKAVKRSKSTRTAEWRPRYSFVRSAFSGPDTSGPDAPVETRYLHIVEPVEIPMQEFGPRWQKAAKRLGEEIAEIDLET